MSVIQPEEPPADLLESFKDAVRHANKLKLSSEQMFDLYGLYKQTTVGDCTESKPKGMTKVIAASKWKAWKELQGVPPLQTMHRYIEYVSKISGTFNPDEAIAAQVNSAVESLNKKELIATLERLEELRRETTDINKMSMFNQLMSKLTPVIEELEKISEDTEIALKCVSKSRMKSVLEDARKMRQDNIGLRKVREMLALDEKEFVQAEYERAKEVNDIERMRHREIRLMQYKYDQADASEYDFKDFGNFRSPEEFAKSSFTAKLFGSTAKLQEGMLLHSTKVIPTSLTKHSCESDPAFNTAQTKKDIKRFRQEAKKNFKSVLAYMGDSSSKGPICKPKSRIDSVEAASDILARGLNAYKNNDNDMLREMYLQMIKQLTENPSEEKNDSGNESGSFRNGLTLFAMMLSVFPACTQSYETDERKAATFDDVVIMWILHKLDDKEIISRYMSALHNTKYGDKMSVIPDPENLRTQFDKVEGKFEIGPNADTGPSEVNLELYL